MAYVGAAGLVAAGTAVVATIGIGFLKDILLSKDNSVVEHQMPEEEYIPTSKTSFGDVVSEAVRRGTVKVTLKDVKDYDDQVNVKFAQPENENMKITENMMKDGVHVNNDEIFCKDTEIIEKMVKAAKSNDFDVVWPVLDEHPNFVNCIPERRAWSVLHQAIYNDNIEAVKKLTRVYCADIGVQTKRDKAGEAEAGTDALALARKFGRDRIFNLMLQCAVVARVSRQGKNISYFIPHVNGQIYPLRNNPLLRLILASYRCTFFHNQIVFHDELHPNDHTAKIMRLIFMLISGKDKWIKVQSEISKALGSIDLGLACYLQDAKGKDAFFKMIIKLYTKESALYRKLAPAFSRQSNKPYMAHGTDLSIGPFAIMLNTILLHWDGLEQCEEVTFRGVRGDVTDNYTTNQSFLFHSFVSSSKLESEAERFRGYGSGTMFIFDNNIDSIFRPRIIDSEELTDYPNEKECLYPLGAEFRVTKVDRYNRKVHLQLLIPAM